MEAMSTIKFLAHLVPEEEPQKDAYVEETAQHAVRGLLDLYVDKCVMVPDFPPEEPPNE